MVKITSHTLVKNEARFVWYAVSSVIDYVDKVLLWDTGSTDNTVQICKEIKKVYGQKVDFREIGHVTTETFQDARQKMLEATKTEWFVVVDGDEVWWEDSIQKVTKAIRDKGKETEMIVVPTINLVGDIYHYQEEAAGQYHLAGRVGHYNLRAVNRSIPGLHSMGEHGKWGWVDGDGKMIQDRNTKNILYVDASYLHATNIQRSDDTKKEKDVPKREKKLKYEIGQELPKDFYYPEVFFKPRPKIVRSVWQKANTAYKIRAAFQTPFKKIKRRVPFTEKVGY